MKLRAYGVLLFLIISNLGFSKPAEEQSVTFVVTGNVRAEFNLCG